MNVIYPQRMAIPSPIKEQRLSGNNKNMSHSLKRRTIEDYKKLQVGVKDLDIKNVTSSSFSDLPLSGITAKGLEVSHYKTMTDIQVKAIPYGLKGHDILGAAKTGSGKTLAFLVPVLENLYRQRWTELDGLGALIISPTRELAIQIFEVLRKIGRYHTFSAGLIIGGRGLQEERERLGRMNIIVCTPGRILQHLDQTAAFEVDNIQVLVLDEADRIMDMGFQSSVDAILNHLPKKRQTMLFSATQTKKVSDLARLSLKDPEYVAVHQAASIATPSTLKQHYIVTPLPEKLNMLFSFIRANLKAKILVFLSSGKQVRFVYESFRHLQPGISLLHLHGRQKQTARLNITAKFSASKNSCLFATDVVARGLDFPAVDWVVQLDCPEDADTYIHRVGRTARYGRYGRAILFLDPGEEKTMLARLEHKRVPIERVNVRQNKKQSIQNQLQNMCFQDPELKYLGQKAFISYSRSIFVQKDKELFDITKIDLEGFAASMGLPGAPKIKFQKGDNAKEIKNASRKMPVSSDDDTETVVDAKKEIKGKIRTKYDRMFKRRNQDVLSSHFSKLIAEGKATSDQDRETDAGEGDSFLSVKRILSNGDGVNHQEVGLSEVSGVKIISGFGKQPIVVNSKSREKLLKSKKKFLKFKGKGTKLVFGENGEAHEIYELQDEDDFRQQGTAESQRTRFVDDETSRIQKADMDDKHLEKEKRRQKKERCKRRAKTSIEESGTFLPTLPEDGGAEDPLALLASLPMVSDNLGRPRKRPKNWLNDSSDDGKINCRPANLPLQAAEEPQTLEDLEALAAGLLK